MPAKKRTQHKPWKRGLLKLSGEALGGKNGQGIDHKTIQWIARDIQTIIQANHQLAVVIGAGNILRGQIAQNSGMNRVTADHAGMLATLINALALHSALESINVKSVVLSAFPAGNFVQTYNQQNANTALNNKYVTILAGGTGNPFFSTDSAATLRAAELNCDIIFKATKVNGVYNQDPVKYPNATRFLTLNYEDALIQNLNVMDRTAIAMLSESHIPLIVFKLSGPNSIPNAANQKGNFTLLDANLKTKTEPQKSQKPQKKAKI
ncbi:MAG: UMP kinase [Alphaproteobacteria bacterium]